MQMWIFIGFRFLFPLHWLVNVQVNGWQIKTIAHIKGKTLCEMLSAILIQLQRQSCYNFTAYGCVFTFLRFFHALPKFLAALFRLSSRKNQLGMHEARFFGVVNLVAVHVQTGT